MNANRKKLCLIVLPLAGLALIVDRVLLGTTDNVAPAQGAPIPTAPSTATPTPEKDQHAGAALIPELPFPRDLPIATGPPRDWFEPPESALAEKTESLLKSGALSASEKDERTPQERFASEYTLEGIVLLGNVRIAIINGRRVRIGDEIGDCIVQRMEGRTVWFDCAGTTVRLTLFDRTKAPGN